MLCDHEMEARRTWVLGPRALGSVFQDLYVGRLEATQY